MIITGKKHLTLCCGCKEDYCAKCADDEDAECTECGSKYCPECKDGMYKDDFFYFCNEECADRHYKGIMKIDVDGKTIKPAKR